MEWVKGEKKQDHGWRKKFAYLPVDCDTIILGSRTESPQEKYDRTVWCETYMLIKHKFSWYGRIHTWSMAITRSTYLQLSEEERVQWAEAMKQIVQARA